MNNKVSFLSILLIIIFIMIIVGCVKQNTPPSATFTITPETGGIGEFFIFDASGSSDIEDASEDLRVRWDWDSLNGWNTLFSNQKIEQHKFISPGTYTIILQVRDTRDLITNISKKLIVTGVITSSFIDLRDNKSYKSVKIGNQWWMAENLNYDTFEGSWCFDDNPANCNIYGRLYNFPAFTYACPDGWHLPTDDEWKELERFAGMDNTDLNDKYPDLRESGKVGDKLRSDYGWNHDMHGTNEYKFNVLPGGWYINRPSAFDNRYYLGYNELGMSTKFWTDTERSNNYYWVRWFYSGMGINRTTWRTVERAYIRCVKD